ncbi:uncharacterized protein N7511_005397 [Penicillium nucicola]|uniref:uncharacterized protein n=1 Tax=Penicillium nucicola TaxID=1850975 RepID=UPI00254550F1|nr:uncharacterized protein N7511_005397 [Penicillium nucicola]KAJ5762015.1 hypothetical protein N7511_005397 [Penicillium nucicola]
MMGLLRLMRAGALALLFSVPALAVDTSNSTQQIFVTSHKPVLDVTKDVQALYDLRNHTFDLPEHFGPNARISHIYLTNTTDDFPLADFFDTGSSTSLTTIKKRYSETVTTRTCLSPPQYDNRLITYQQQVFIAGELCDFVANVSPYFYTFVGMKIQNLACGEDFGYTCTGFWGIANTAAGAYIGPGIKAMCKKSYDSLIAACDEKGGYETVKIKQTGKSFEVFGYANSEESESCTSVGRTTCEVYRCDGDCNPGGGTP